MPLAETCSMLSGFDAQGHHDAPEPHENCLKATEHDHRARPIQHGEIAEMSISSIPPKQRECNPRAKMQRDHPPRFGHETAELSLHADSLAKGADVSREQRENSRP